MPSNLIEQYFSLKKNNSNMKITYLKCFACSKSCLKQSLSNGFYYKCDYCKLVCSFKNDEINVISFKHKIKNNINDDFDWFFIIIKNASIEVNKIVSIYYTNPAVKITFSYQFNINDWVKSLKDLEIKVIRKLKMNEVFK